MTAAAYPKPNTPIRADFLPGCACSAYPCRQRWMLLLRKAELPHRRLPSSLRIAVRPREAEAVLKIAHLCYPEMKSNSELESALGLYESAQNPTESRRPFLQARHNRFFE